VTLRTPKVPFATRQPTQAHVPNGTLGTLNVPNGTLTTRS
jgi:hypothetical protein